MCPEGFLSCLSLDALDVSCGGDVRGVDGGLDLSAVVTDGGGRSGGHAERSDESEASISCAGDYCLCAHQRLNRVLGLFGRSGAGNVYADIAGKDPWTFRLWRDETMGNTSETRK